MDDEKIDWESEAGNKYVVDHYRHFIECAADVVTAAAGGNRVGMSGHVLDGPRSERPTWVCKMSGEAGEFIVEMPAQGPFHGSVYRKVAECERTPDNLEWKVKT